MKQLVILLGALMLLSAGAAFAGEIKLSAVKGEVYVRHGVQEEWVRVAAGDVLKPEDSMRLEKKSSATLLVDGRKLTVPEMVVLDLSDLRALTQEELLLKLAMERVRSAPAQQEGELSIPRTTTMHGASKEGAAPPGVPPAAAMGRLQLNGAKVLFDNGYYATCILKAKEVFRRVPAAASNLDARLLVASALEKIDLGGEALGEYTELAREPQLPPQVRQTVKERIARLQKKSR